METTSPAPRRVPFFWIGVVFFVLGPILYTVQCQLGYLEMVPWYFPVLSTFGVLCMLTSVLQRGGVLRGIGLAFFVIFCGLQWFFFTVLTRTPDYQGPVQVGSKFPTFCAALADGTAFTNTDLDASGPTALHFFRGRWCVICMIELRQLEKQHAEFAKRGVKIVAISNDDQATTKETQAAFPHLTIVSDKDQSLARAVEVLHKGVAPDGGDTNAPTTFLLDKSGTVRWLFRPNRYIVRVSPESLLSAIDASGVGR